MNKTKVYELLNQIVGKEHVLLDELMSKHTTFKIGGPADIFVVPKTVEEVKAIIDVCKNENIDFYVIGKGSNLLVGDKGFRAVIICLYNTLDNVKIVDNNEDTSVIAGAGIMLSKLANIIADNNLEGFEFASGIPGTLGGACVMNAGAYGGEMKDILVEVTVLTQDGDIVTLAKDELELGYRTSIIAKKGYIVLAAVIKLEAGSRDEIKAIMDNLKEQRVTKQPLEFPSAGSTFKRPEGHFAGKLIQDADLRGFKVGGAQVSEKHCGFVINAGGATAHDVDELMKQVSAKVKEQFGVNLEPEVKRLGEF
jgi:UDP-N-acetylmuramate dehydrogenase